MDLVEQISNPRHAQFVVEYVNTLFAADGTPCVGSPGKAALACGYSAKSADSVGRQLLARKEIYASVVLRLQNTLQPIGDGGIDAKRVLQMWVDIASADPGELVELRHLNCRHCWGIGHAYQWNAREYADAAAKAMTDGKLPPLMEGGDGWRKTRDPNPDCPECCGEGVEDVKFKDTRHLKGKARLLYAGVKTTKNGVEILMRDQDAALANIAKALGMFVERREHSGPNGGPIPVASINVAVPVDPQEASRLYQALMEGKTV